MLRGVLLGFGTYFLYSLSDACLKASGFILRARATCPTKSW